MMKNANDLRRELEALQAENARLKAERPETQYEILVHSIDGIVWEVDVATLRFTFVSPQAERILGYPLKHWYEPNFWRDHLHPADRDWAMAFCQDAVQACRNHRFDYRMIAAHGRTVWLHDVVTIVVEHDRPVKLRGVMIDITERKQAEAKLREIEELFERFMDNTPAAAWITDTEGRLLYLNRAYTHLTGFTAEQALGRSIFDLYPTVDVNMFIENKRQIFETGESLEVVVTGPRDDGTLGHLYTVNFPITDGAGQRMLGGVGVDITDRVRAEEALHELAGHLQSVREEERARVAREMHDELGQALTGLKLELASLQRGVQRNIEAQSLAPLLEQMKTMNAQIDATIQSIRRIATELRPAILDMLGLVPALEWQAQDFQERTGIACVFVSSLETVNLDHESATAVFRIFQESLTNVLRHAQATRVRASLDEKEGTLTLAVQDNGIGIDDTKLSASKSFGLLSMRERALLLGGEVQIEGSLGQGMTITARIPIHPPR